MIIDTHVHFTDALFDADLPEVISEAGEKGVRRMILVTEGADEYEKGQAIASRFRGIVYPAAGLFPDADIDEGAADALEEALSARKWIAVGEVGLDFWLAKSEAQREAQREIFTHVVRCAKKANLPLNIHSRSAAAEVVTILERENYARVQMHALEAKPSVIRRCVENGYFISMPVSVLHSAQKQKMAKSVSPDNLLFETDSPVLGPDRESRNVPSNIVTAIEETARIKGMSYDDLVRITSENAEKLYRFENFAF